MILLDADILVDGFRGYRAAVSWLASTNDEIVAVGMAAMELLQGCRDAAALRETRSYLSDYRVVWPGKQDFRRAYARFGDQRLRYGLDVLDALIAETAIGLNVPLHTFNTRHFAAYPELQTIQPYAKA